MGEESKVRRDALALGMYSDHPVAGPPEVPERLNTTAKASASAVGHTSLGSGRGIAHERVVVVGQRCYSLEKGERGRIEQCIKGAENKTSSGDGKISYSRLSSNCIPLANARVVVLFALQPNAFRYIMGVLLALEVASM